MYKTQTVGNNSFYYLEYGTPEKETLLFLHGYADSALMFAKLGQSLSHKYHVLCLDFPMIHEPDKVQSIQSLANFAKEFIESQGLEDFSLIGFSLGGSVSIELISLNKIKIKNLYLLNSVPQFLPTRFMRDFYKTVKPIITTKFGSILYSRFNTNSFLREIFHAPPITNTVISRMRDYPISIYGTLFDILDLDLTEKFNSIKVPKTVVLFKDDTIVPWKRYRDYIEKLEANLVVFDKGWHAAKKQYWNNVKSLWLKSYTGENFVEEKVEI